jgi:hypothetical protein
MTQKAGFAEFLFMLPRIATTFLLLSSFGGPILAETASSQKSNGVSRAVPVVATDKKGPGQVSRGACQLGLIAIVGNKFEITSEAHFAFQNTHRYAPVDWNLDDLVYGRVQAAARGLAVRNISYDKVELHRASQKYQPFTSFASKILDFARKTSAGTSCDRYVVVHRELYPVATTRYSPVGFGITLVHSFPAADRAFLHALTSIRIYDGQTFELIKEARATTGPPPRPFDLSADWHTYQPVQEVDPAAFPTTPQQAAKNPVFRDAVRSLLVKSLDWTLPTLLRPDAQPGRS